MLRSEARASESGEEAAEAEEEAEDDEAPSEASESLSAGAGPRGRAPPHGGPRVAVHKR